MQYKDYYQILGVKKDASEDEIKRAFRIKAKELHPDPHPKEEEQLWRTKFQEVNEAYQILSNPNLRDKYNPIYDQEQTYQEQIKQAAAETKVPPPQPTTRPTTNPNPKTQEDFSRFWREEDLDEMMSRILKETDETMARIIRETDEFMGKMAGDLNSAAIAMTQRKILARAVIEADQRKIVAQREREQQVLEKQEQENQRREKVLDTKLALPETDRLLISAVVRFHQNKEQKPLVVTNDKGQTVYEIGIDKRYTDGSLRISRSLVDRLDQPTMLRVSSFGIIGNKEIRPEELMDLEEIEQLANDNRGLASMQGITKYALDLKIIADVVANPEGSNYKRLYGKGIIPDINRYLERQHREETSHPLREITKDLDLSRLKEKTTPQAIEGQLPASRL